MRGVITRRRNIYCEIKKYIQNLRKQVFLLGVIEFVLLLLGLISPYLFKVLIDDVMIGNKIDILKWICTAFVILYLIETLIKTGQKVISNRVFNKVTFNVRHKIWKNYLNMPFERFEKYNPGDLKNRVDTYTDTVEKFIGQQIIDYIFYWVLVVIYGIVLLFINWKLAAFGFLMVPLSFWMTKWMGKGVERTNRQYWTLWGKYEGWLRNSIQGWKEIKLLGINRKEKIIFTKHWHFLSNLFFTKQMYYYGNRTFIAIKDFFITRMNLYFIGGLLIFSGELTIGSLLVFMKYYEQFFAGIGSINNLDLDLSNDIPAIEKVEEIIKEPIDQSTKVFNRFDFCNKIKFSGVCFRYNEAQNYILSDINLSIYAKEKIAIVGRSGCGKTTLLKTLLGLYSPQKGCITIDGNDIRLINSSVLHALIGVVMQDSILFNMSIKENLLIAKPSATELEIKEACKLAYIDEFIESLDDGYMTLIGEKGIKLSGGQKQRLAIARVMLTKPDIIVFDEATSSLDHESEKMVHKAIDNISRDRTVVIIAHRLSSILSADRVIVIDSGKIVGDGHHSKLLGVNAVYDRLFKRQYESLTAS